MKKQNRILILAGVALCMGTSLFYWYNKDQTSFPSETTIGNSAGNLYNGGLVAEYDNFLYYSNFEEDGILYQSNADLSNPKPINNDRAAYINVTDDYIIYSRQNNLKESHNTDVLGFSNVGIYRIDKNGTNSIQLDKTPAGTVSLSGPYVYYQHYSKENAYELFRIKLDGTEKKRLSSDPIIPAMFHQETLYYSNFHPTHDLMKLNTSSLNSRLLLKGNVAMPLVIDSYIYYLSLSDNYSILRSDLDGSNPTVIVPTRCSTYNISGKDLYYQVDNAVSNGLYHLNLETMESTLIKEGNFRNINLSSQYVFYQDIKKDTLFTHKR